MRLKRLTKASMHALAHGLCLNMHSRPLAAATSKCSNHGRVCAAGTPRGRKGRRRMPLPPDAFAEMTAAHERKMAEFDKRDAENEAAQTESRIEAQLRLHM